MVLYIRTFRKLEWIKVIFKLNIKRNVLLHCTFSIKLFWFLSSVICESYCLNIIVNINSFSALNISVNTTLKYYGSQSLNENLKLMGGAMKSLLKSYWTIIYFALWSPRLQDVFWKNCKTLLPTLPHTYVHSLTYFRSKFVGINLHDQKFSQKLLKIQDFR